VTVFHDAHCVGASSFAPLVAWLSNALSPLSLLRFSRINLVKLLFDWS
jgi:hypothetical protein